MVVKNFSFKIFLSAVLLFALGLEASQRQQITLAAPPPSFEEFQKQAVQAERIHSARSEIQTRVQRAHDCCQWCAEVPDIFIGRCKSNLSDIGDALSYTGPTQSGLPYVCCFYCHCGTLLCCYVPCKVLKLCSSLSACCLRTCCCANNTEKKN